MAAATSTGRCGTSACPATTPARNWPTCTKSVRRFSPTWSSSVSYINDFIGNETAPSDRRSCARAGSARWRFLQEHWYSTEFYKRVALTAAWRLSGSESYRAPLRASGDRGAMSAASSEVEAAREQAVDDVRSILDDAGGGACSASAAMPPSAKDLRGTAGAA